MFDATLYAQVLRAAAADRPDFYLAIGDDFSVDTLQNPAAEAVGRIYRTQRAQEWLGRTELQDTSLSLMVANSIGVPGTLAARP
jgi:hypothetical protein